MLEFVGSEEPSGVVGVPDISAEWYLDVAGLGAGSPGVVRVVGAIATEAVVGVFAVVFVVLWWRARRGSAAGVARAVLAPVVTVLAYAASEVIKDLWQEDRPCRVFGEVATIVACPEFGDWSFPSNHATIAGAAAVAILWSSLPLGCLAFGAALLTAGSRVFVGVHYPHDVLAGLLIGAAIAAVLPLSARAVTPVIARLRAHPGGAVLLGRGPQGLPWDDAPTITLPRAQG
ncbi:phosphatase PAP2 family protein [Actinokineospora spheciospongiae]|uniref:phosphatase PAP2 family protein n=1 Tax=Actinokineospora spheciospongiae TaxID=909613 RepID=UPI0009FF566D|nr:phosphatase PAP2 family protein [Actinokineospora spheciospongiae]